MTRVEVQGLSKVMAKLEKLAKWSEKDHNALVDINTRVGDVYAGSLRANIKDFGKDIKVYEKNQGPGRNPGNAPGKVRMIVKSGQLRRSVDTWLPNRAAFIHGICWINCCASYKRCLLALCDESDTRLDT